MINWETRKDAKIVKLSNENNFELLLHGWNFVFISDLVKGCKGNSGIWKKLIW